MLKRLFNRCSVSGCWRRARHTETQMFGWQGIRSFGSSTLTFHHCDRHHNSR